MRECKTCSQRSCGAGAGGKGNLEGGGEGGRGGEDVADKDAWIDGGEQFTLGVSENYPLILKNLPPICASSSQFL